MLIEPRSEGKSEIRLPQYHVFQILKSNFQSVGEKTGVALVLSRIKDFKTIFNSFDVKNNPLKNKGEYHFQTGFDIITLCIGIIRLVLDLIKKHLVNTFYRPGIFQVLGYNSKQNRNDPGLLNSYSRRSFSLRMAQSGGASRFSLCHRESQLLSLLLWSHGDILECGSFSLNSQHL